MNKTFAILFAISCFFTSTVSSRLLGVGIWFWIIIAIGLLVAASQFIPGLKDLGSALAAVLATLSVLAVLLTLLVSTIGGSFELEGGDAMLVFGFFMIAVFGFTLSRLNKRKPIQHIDI